MMLHVYNSIYSGGKVRRIEVQGQPGPKIARPYLKNKLRLEAWLKW
jgi:hypothetical protein